MCNSRFHRPEEFIEAQPQEELECIAKKLETTGDAEVQVDGKSFALKDLAVFERKKEKAGYGSDSCGIHQATTIPKYWYNKVIE